MLYEGMKAPVSLKIIIVGGGIGGLSAAHCLNRAGHQVTVIDPRDLPAEFGAGVQLSPNVTRILFKWGLKAELDRVCQVPNRGYLKAYDSGEQISAVPYSIISTNGDGSPFYGIHRPELVTMLYNLVKDDITIVKGKVASVDTVSPSVTLGNGDVLTGDLIIGADGIRSIVRPTIVKDAPIVSGHTAYRAVISVDEMMEDPDLREMPIHDLHCWLGPRKRVITYGIGRGLYNLVLLAPDEDPEGPWVILADLDELKACFADWDPRLQKILSLIKFATRYKLVVRAPIDNWVHETGRVALLGDSAHAMLPYYAQGAAMAIEDAAVLGELFSRISSTDQIGSYLQVYQELRIARSNATMAKSLASANALNIAHEKEGNANLTLLVSDEPKQNPYSEKEQAEIQYGYDAYKAVDNWRASLSDDHELCQK